jgi:hypothetical protein
VLPDDSDLLKLTGERVVAENCVNVGENVKGGNLRGVLGLFDLDCTINLSCASSNNSRGVGLRSV